jgi:hypothetical protein
MKISLKKEGNPISQCLIWKAEVGRVHARENLQASFRSWLREKATRPGTPALFDTRKCTHLLALDYGDAIYYSLRPFLSVIWEAWLWRQHVYQAIDKKDRGSRYGVLGRTKQYISTTKLKKRFRSYWYLWTKSMKWNLIDWIPARGHSESCDGK